jgi:hypothetical protein
LASKLAISPQLTLGYGLDCFADHRWRSVDGKESRATNVKHSPRQVNICRRTNNEHLDKSSIANARTEFRGLDPTDHILGNEPDAWGHLDAIRKYCVPRTRPEKHRKTIVR